MKSEEILKERIRFLKECLASDKFTLSKQRLFNDWINASEWVLESEEK